MDIQTAIELPWGGERNLALRSALGIEEGEVCLVNQGDVVQVVVAERTRAKEIHDALRPALGHQSSVSYFRRADGQWLVSAHRN